MVNLNKTVDNLISSMWILELLKKENKGCRKLLGWTKKDLEKEYKRLLKIGGHG